MISKICDLEMWVRGRSKSSKLVPFDAYGFLLRPIKTVHFRVSVIIIMTLTLKCTVFEIFAFEKYRNLETKVTDGKWHHFCRLHIDIL